MFTILLVEDDPTIRFAIEFALTHEGYAVISAASGDEALEKYAAGSPDLILLDVMLPGMSGHDVARHVRAEGGEQPIIMITALGEESDKVAGLDAGADDYVTKPLSTAELLARIRAHLRRVSKGAAAASSEPLVFGDMRIDRASARVYVGDAEVPLRSKEYKLLVALAGRAGALATRQWISNEVWGENFLTTSRTIDVHVRRIRSAIDPLSDYEFIHTVHGMGYRFEPVAKEGVAS